MMAFAWTNPAFDSGDSDHTCRALEGAVKKSTGYDVKLAVKQHKTLLQQLQANDVVKTVVIKANDDLLLKPGNCIPRGLASFFGMDVVKAKLTEAGKGTAYQIPGGVQTYRDVADLVGCKLNPYLHIGDVGAG